MTGTRRNLPFRRVRHFGYWLFLLLASAMLLQGWMFLTILDRTVGPIENLRHPGGPPVRVALLKSWTSAALSDPDPQGAFDAEQQWEVILEESGIPYRVIGDEDLTVGVSSYANVLILPSAVCLSDEHRAAIRDLAQRGIGIVASGALGARNGDCAWRGWDTLTSVTGLKLPETFTITQPAYAIIRGGQFFSEAVPTGYRLGVPPQELVFGTSHSPDLFWSDARLKPTRGDSADAAALGTHGVYGAGRVVWFGFKEALPDSASKDQRLALNAYLSSAVRWVGRQPMATLRNWPGDARAAVVIAETVTDSRAALAAASIFRVERASATFLVDSSKAHFSPSEMRRLEAAGEIASAGDTDLAFTGRDADGQAARLRNARASLEQMGSKEVLGFDPPQQVWNDGTVSALEKTGYSYFFDHLSNERAVPEILHMPVPQGSPSVDPVEISRISVMGANDVEEIARYRGPTPWGDDLADGFVRNFRMAEFLGGVYTLDFRSDLLGAPENLHVLRALLHQIKTARPWMASGREMADWWTQRDRIHVSTRMIAPSRIRLSIANRDTRPLTAASVYVYLPRKPKLVRILPALLNRISPRTEILNGNDDVLRLDFPKLNPASAYECVIVMEER